MKLRLSGTSRCQYTLGYNFTQCRAGNVLSPFCLHPTLPEMTWTHLGVLPVIGCSSYFVEACVWGSWTLSILHMHRADHSSAIMYKILLLSVYIHCGTSSNDKAHGKTADAWEIAIFFLCTFYLVLTKFDLALKAASATSIFCNEISHHASEFWPGCWLTRFWMNSCNIHHSGTLSDVIRRSSFTLPAMEPLPNIKLEVRYHRLPSCNCIKRL